MTSHIQVRQAFEAFEAGDDTGRVRVGLGDRGADECQLEGEAGRRGPAHVVLRGQQQGDDPGDLAGGELLGLHAQLLVPVGLDVEEVVLSGSGLDQQEVPEVRERLGRHVADVLAVLHQAVDDLERGAGVADRDGIGELVLDLAARRAEERLDHGVVDGLAAHDARLIQQRERVAGRPLGLASDRERRGLRDGAPLGRGDRLELRRERLHGEPPELEPLAPAHDGRRHLVRLGGRQHESNAFGRFLEHLEQRVERFAGQPLRLVDDVDLLATHRRRGRSAFAELAGILDAAVRCRVDLDHVQVLALADGDALRADPARLGRRAVLAVDHLRQDPGGGRLARPSGPAEQERVMQAVLTDGAGQCPDDVFLPQHLARCLRPVPPVQRLVLLVLRHVAPTLEK